MRRMLQESYTSVDLAIMMLGLLRMYGIGCAEPSAYGVGRNV